MLRGDLADWPSTVEDREPRLNELTQHWHLEHCAHHEPHAILTCLLILLLTFNLFHAFAILHGKLYREGCITLQKLRQQVYRALEIPCSLLFVSG
jgi:hypothetical protein